MTSVFLFVPMALTIHTQTTHWDPACSVRIKQNSLRGSSLNFGSFLVSAKMSAKLGESEVYKP